MELNAGVKIDGRYDIQELIGEGGMANVYLANDIILNRQVAVKVLHEQLAKQERFVERFRREAEAVASLIHPNIVEIYDVGEYENCYFIVMELLEGKTLKEYVKSKYFLSVSETISIMKQACDAVSLAHYHGIIHRDLKPQNIFIRHDGTIKIMDFGIAYQQDATPLTQTNAVMGSVHYLSPEQAKGEGATIQTDIYSLGIVLYEMLIGEVPFTGDSAVNIVLQHLREEIPYVTEKNVHIPQSVENIIIKATAKDSNNRYKNAIEMKNDLDTCLNVERMNEPRLYFVPAETEENIAPEIEKTLEDVEVENEINSDVQQQKSNKKRLVIIILAVIATIMLGAGIIMASLSNADKVIMPEVYNLTLQEARGKLLSVNLLLGQTTEEASEEIAYGHVIRASHEPGIKIEEETRIDLVISRGRIVKMIEVIGRQEAEAVARLGELGIIVNIEYEAPANDEEDGTVMRQSIDKDADVLIDEASNNLVTLKVAKKEQIVVRDLKGFTEAEARLYAADNGLEIEVVKFTYDEFYAEGKIAAILDWYDGISVPAGTTIRVVISEGPEPEPELETSTTTNNVIPEDN